MADDEIPAAVLTPKQRAYLRSKETDITPAAERAMRSRIRKRIATAIAVDFPVLLHGGWKADDREKAFKPIHAYLKRYTDVMEDGIPSEQLGNPEHWQWLDAIDDDFRDTAEEASRLIHGFAATVALAYLVSRDVEPKDPPDLFTNIVERGVVHAAETNGEIATIEHSLEVNRSGHDLSDLRDRFLDGEDLTPEEITQLMNYDPGFIEDVLAGRYPDSAGGTTIKRDPVTDISDAISDAYRRSESTTIDYVAQHANMEAQTVTSELRSHSKAIANRVSHSILHDRSPDDFSIRDTGEGPETIHSIIRDE